MESKKDLNHIISATELKNNLGVYLDYVIDNNEMIITKNGKKAVRLSPYITDYDRYLMVKEKAADYLYQYDKKCVSYDEFREIYEKSEQRMEFLNGEIFVMDSPNAFHQTAAGNLYYIIREFLKDRKCKVFIAPFDVHFYKKDLKVPDVLQPDLFIACDTDKSINPEGRYMGIPSLVIEILSGQSRSRDMVVKLNTYVMSGVSEYWIIDCKQKTVIVYGFKDYNIDSFVTFRGDDTVRSYSFEGLEISTLEIFK